MEGFNMRTILTSLVTLIAGLGFSVAHATTATEGDYLVKFAPNTSKLRTEAVMNLLPANTKVESLGDDSTNSGWVHVTVPPKSVKAFGINALSNMPGVVYAQPNYRIFLRESPTLTYLKAGIAQMIAYKKANGQWPTDDKCPFPIPQLCPPNGGGGGGGGGDDKCPFPIPQLCPPNGGGGGGGGGSDQPAADNPDIPAPTTPATGADPLIAKQWGMIDIGAEKAWPSTKGNEVVVAVIDTGVDYTHEDLVDSLWRNPGEMGTDAQGKNKSNNGIDDDANGFVDDVIGWDFVSNDNKPYDLASSTADLISGQGGNPGHGTHCSGNVGARGNNGKGISGVDPNARIMGLRFLSEKGEGTTAGAVKAINYALKNGAQVMSNSWGSEGEDPGEAADNQALHDAIHAAEAKGVLFIAAAGNGRQASQMSQPAGYDNDSDAKPGMPASYPDDIIISVAAVDSSGNLGSFSNYGKKTVHIGAPGVKIFSTTVGSKYSDMVIDMGGMQASWDGTSMATPHVAGAAALYISTHPHASWQQTKNAILKGAAPTPSLTGKVSSDGRLSIDGMMKN
jgi:thermitase